MMIQDVRDRYARGETVVDVIRSKIEQLQASDEFHTLISVISDRALERAAEIDRRQAAGEDAGPLAGIPFLAKDNMVTFGSATTAGSRMLEQYQAPYQAEVIERLEAAGAICVGKSNLDAFAHGSSTENSFFGPTKNPHDPTRVPGGTSGGSAAAVALSTVPFALGTDTGGSIRQPASFCGVYGMKPTYGAVSRYGIIASASSTDTIGAFGTEPADVQLVMHIIAGQDSKDSTTVKDVYGRTPQKVKKVGVIRETIAEGVDSEVIKVLQDYAAQLKTQGIEVVEVSLPTFRYALAAYYVVVPAEIASNLARYDGIRYGYHPEVSTLDQLYVRSRSEGFMPENKRRLMVGNYVLSSEHFDVYYKKAQTVRTKLINEYLACFAECDALLSPTAPAPAFKLGDNTADPLQMYLADIMTVPPSLAGLPALNIPAGISSEGLPIGVQLIGPQKSDEALLQLAQEVQRGIN